MRIIIIGSGIAGLTAAIGLRQVGIEVVVALRQGQPMGAAPAVLAAGSVVRLPAARVRDPDLPEACLF